MSVLALAGFWLLIQQPVVVSDRAAYNRIVDEARVEPRIRLALEFEKRFPGSSLLADVYMMLMDDYAAKNDAKRTLEYGEKAVKAKPENLRALVVVSHQLAMLGVGLDRAAAYAERAIRVADHAKGQPVPAGYGRQVWLEFLSRSRASAEGTLKYIREIPSNLLRRRP